MCVFLYVFACVVCVVCVLCVVCVVFYGGVCWGVTWGVCWCPRVQSGVPQGGWRWVPVEMGVGKAPAGVEIGVRKEGPGEEGV